MTAISFSLNPDLEPRLLRQAYKRHGRVRIQGFLASSAAAALHTQLLERTDWLQVINSGELLYELDRDIRAQMEPGKAAALDQAVYAGARNGFQFRFESIRVPDDADARLASADLLAGLATFLSSPAVIALFHDITGEGAIRFSDAQATAYSPGDFLTGHDDAVDGKHRFAAYVLGLTPRWRLEWGGQLLFHGDHGTISHGEMPGFNTLDLFTVPQLHSVSEVTRAAANRRYSVTGWLRG
ncbi:2OG-Fe(II) oxygenase family protein [Blastomonas sp.]|uniref:2OG-Fe(II) oxygenase n=1 Tax=Blastomonas sp. TaxID=1909299 RepID=UPI0026041EF7|nr:2OG-Fe(II) oxygenase family protein [Blastomonas sp.]MDM7955531.1 2OG-Fe(II) oxygenase family protein [Blastomonas sp.]